MEKTSLMCKEIGHQYTLSGRCIVCGHQRPTREEHQKRVQLELVEKAKKWYSEDQDMSIYRVNEAIRLRLLTESGLVKMYKQNYFHIEKPTFRGKML